MPTADNHHEVVNGITPDMKASHRTMKRNGLVAVESLESEPPSTADSLQELFAENIAAKLLRTAVESLPKVTSGGPAGSFPIQYPETVPQTGPNAGQWEYRELMFWTCGFFPGSLYALLERCVKFPHKVFPSQGTTHVLGPAELRRRLRPLCENWAEPMHEMARRTDTHDVGFMVMPALQRDWELHGNERSLGSVIQGAKSLASRYNRTAKAIRSWDILVKHEITVTDMEENLLVIIDSLCNLDIMFYAAAHSNNKELAAMAESHARTLLHSHLRPENPSVAGDKKRVYKGQLYSTCHVANIDPRSGSLKWRWTAQGYSNESTWARGQSWAILGYAQTYVWTKDEEFLWAACGTAEYFLHRLDNSPSCVETSSGHQSKKGRYVPLWDFDAPVNEEEPLRDSSAGMIAANGMLILSQALRSLQKSKLADHFLDHALRIARDTVDHSLSQERAQFCHDDDSGDYKVVDTVAGQTFAGIVKNGTANNNENARRRYANHTLVYGDYYFVEFGNRLLAMGLA